MTAIFNAYTGTFEEFAYSVTMNTSGQIINGWETLEKINDKCRD